MEGSPSAVASFQGTLHLYANEANMIKMEILFDLLIQG